MALLLLISALGLGFFVGQQLAARRMKVPARATDWAGAALLMAVGATSGSHLLGLGFTGVLKSGAIAAVSIFCSILAVTTLTKVGR